VPSVTGTADAEGDADDRRRAEGTAGDADPAGAGAGARAGADGTTVRTVTRSTKSETKPVDPTDDLVTTAHTLKIGRSTLRYHASTGRIVLREEIYTDGTFEGRQAKAEVAITTYTRDGADAHTRPVTFAFNGGPGSSSVWLHMGLLGPRRVVMGDAGELHAPPYALADNPESLLAVSDLVLIDPVSTGWSRAAEGAKPGAYHGFRKDVESVAEVIRLWVGRNGRWMSPKFVAGESYGTTRAAALAEHLQSEMGMYLNGLLLISSVLDFGSGDFDAPRNDRAHALYLPHYAAAAHYHGKHGRRSLKAVLKEAEEYAADRYPWALARGNRLTAAERADAVSTVAGLAGLSADYVERADLRIEHWRFYTELLRDQRLSIGRIDARFTGPAASAIAEHMDADPSIDAISGPYTAAFQHYVRSELEYESDLHFQAITARVYPWSYKEFEGRPVYVVDKLERAMRQNPHLKVHFSYGYYDGATPYFAAEDVVAHLNLPDHLVANIEHAHYEAGHMMYVHEPSRLQQCRDLAAFVTASVPPR